MAEKVSIIEITNISFILMSRMLPTLLCVCSTIISWQRISEVLSKFLGGKFLFIQFEKMVTLEVDKQVCPHFLFLFHFMIKKYKTIHLSIFHSNI